MRKLIVVAGLVLAGCGADPAALRTFAESQVAAYNAAGIDPAQLGVAEQMYVALACSTLSGAAALSERPEMGGEIAQWCRVALQAAAPAE